MYAMCPTPRNSSACHDQYGVVQTLDHCMEPYSSQPKSDTVISQTISQKDHPSPASDKGIRGRIEIYKLCALHRKLGQMGQEKFQVLK